MEFATVSEYDAYYLLGKKPIVDGDHKKVGDRRRMKAWAKNNPDRLYINNVEARVKRGCVLKPLTEVKYKLALERERKSK